MTNEEGTGVMRAIECDRKTAALYLLHYEERKADYEAARDEYLKKDGRAGGARGSLPGKPTETLAVKGADYDLQHDEYFWLQAVAIAERTLSDRRLIFLQVRREAEQKKGHLGFRSGRKAWRAYVQAVFPERVEERYWQSEKPLYVSTMQRWWDEMVNTVMLAHSKLEKNHFGHVQNGG